MKFDVKEIDVDDLGSSSPSSPKEGQQFEFNKRGQICKLLQIKEWFQTFEGLTM